MIYADNAATTRLDPDAYEAMKPYFFSLYGNASQPYSFSRKSKLALKEARRIIAKCINADPEKIYFTSGGTESDNWAIKCFGLQNSKKIIITSPIEHHAILNACKDSAIETKFIKVNSIGEVSEKSLNDALKDVSKSDSSSMNCTLVSIMYANNEIGTIQNIKKLANIAHNYGALFHTDAVQAVGHIKIDVKELNVDMLSASAHKFNGPKGIGFLYIRKGTNISSFNSGGFQEFGLRAGTENIPAIVGMAVALEKNINDIELNIKHINKVVESFFERIKFLKSDYILNGSNNRIPGNISISFKFKNGESILHLLDLQGVCISTGSACDSVNDKISHVIEAIGCPDEYAKGTIRISFGKENTVEEAGLLADKLIKILSLTNKV